MHFTTAQAAAHAVRLFVQKMDDSHTVVKLLATPSIQIAETKCWKRWNHLPLTSTLLSTLLNSAPSILQWEGQRSLFSEGVQQGDPLGPLLFCLAIHKHCQWLRSKLCILYLDDVSNGDSYQSILNDMMEAAGLSLTLNSTKSEVITHDHTTLTTILSSLPGAQAVTHVALLTLPFLAHLLVMPQASYHLFWRIFRH